MARYRSTFTVEAMSKTLEVSRSGFYAWLKRGIPRRVLADRELIREMWKIFIGSDYTYRESSRA